MSYLYNVWNLYWLTPQTITFDLTPAQAAIVSKGTTGFILGCLNSCGIYDAIRGWSMHMSRQAYYSDYGHSADWHACWDLVWSIEVDLLRPALHENEFRPFPCKAPTPDETAEGLEEPTLEFGRALILASFDPQVGLQEHIAEVISDWTKQSPILSKHELAFRTYSGGPLQARLIVASVQFPSQIPALDDLQSRFKGLGAATNWRELISQE